MRKSDDNPDTRFFRMPERLFRVNDEWWFSTREQDQGPFPNKEQAQVALDRYATTMQHMKEVQEQRAVEKLEAEEAKPDPTVWDNFDIL